MLKSKTTYEQVEQAKGKLSERIRTRLDQFETEKSQDFSKEMTSLIGGTNDEDTLTSGRLQRITHGNVVVNRRGRWRGRIAVPK